LIPFIFFPAIIPPAPPPVNHILRRMTVRFRNRKQGEKYIFSLLSFYFLTADPAYELQMLQYRAPPVEERQD
jgi:hypothetical protein